MLIQANAIDMWSGGNIHIAEVKQALEPSTMKLARRLSTSQDWELFEETLVEEDGKRDVAVC